MAKESTAISQLIFLARQRPIIDEEDEVTFALPDARPRQRPVVNGFDDDYQATHRIARRDMKRPLIAASIAAASVATFGITVGLTRRHPAPVAAAVTAPAPIAAVEAPVAAPPPARIVAPPPPPATKPALVELALDSQPAGATVVLVDRGHGSMAGTTPLSLSVDPSREYDVVFTLAGRAPKLEHVDPRASQRVAVELPPPDAAPAVAETPAPAPSRHHAHAQARAAAVPAKSSGTGMLMISAKPPCDIAIDGKPTGMVTPQRSIRLAAGQHQITLSNAQQHVKSSMTVTISANHPTKLIRDLMNK